MKKSILMLMAAAALASCSESEVQTPVDAKQVDIVLKSSHHAIEVENSRAPYTGSISEDNPLSARVISSEVSGSYKPSHADGNMIFKGPNEIAAYERTGTITDAQTKFPGGATDQLFLCGLYPATGWTLKGADAATISLDGKKDVMAAAEEVTTKLQTNNGNVPSLTFNHLLTKLEISIKAETAEAIGYWGKVTDIELVNVKGGKPQNQVEVNLKEGTATFSDEGTIGLFGMSGTTEEPVYLDEKYADQKLEMTSTHMAYTIIAPFEAGTAKDLSFLVKTEYAPKGISVDVKLPYTGETNGRAFGVNLIFKGNDKIILGSASVIDWVFSGNVDVPVGQEEENE